MCGAQNVRSRANSFRSVDHQKQLKSWRKRLLKGVLGRIRDVRNGPDGYLYLLTDESSGVMARLKP